MNFSKISTFLTENSVKKLEYDFYESDFSDHQGELGIFCAHNLFFNRSTFNELAQSLSKIADVVCLDLPGHGNSEYVSSYTIDTFVSSCFSIINNCDFKRVIWIGHGLGGLIGLKLATCKGSPLISLVLDDIFAMNVDSKIRSSIMDVKNCSTLIELAEKMNEYLPEGVILKDRMKFAIRNFDLKNGVFVPSYDPNLKNFNENIDLYTTLHKVTQPVLLFLDKDSIPEEQNNCFTKRNIIIENMQTNPMCRYGTIEKERITCWVKNLLKGQLVRNPFETGVG